MLKPGVTLVFVSVTKRPVFSDMQRVNIKCKGRKSYSDIPFDEAAEILQELATQYYEGADFEPSDLELEPIE